MSDKTFNDSLTNPPQADGTADSSLTGAWTEWWQAVAHPRDSFRNFVKTYLLELLSEQQALIPHDFR